MAAQLNWLERRASDRKVRCPYWALHFVVSLGNNLNANFLADTSCGVEDQDNGIYQRKFKKPKKRSGRGTAGISESGSG